MTKRILLTDLQGYFSNLVAPSDEEKQLLTRLKEQLAYFPITTIHRDDLKSRGFDVLNITDETMAILADRMKNDYHTQLYWEHIESLAEYLDIPKTPVVTCPKCRSEVKFDVMSEQYSCSSCGQTWDSNIYVLVEYPDDTNCFEGKEEKDGKNNFFLSYDSADNGALYVPINDYIQYLSKIPDESKCYKPIGWPESQTLMDENLDFEEECEFINDDIGIEVFGEMAYWVPLELLNEE